MESEKKQPVVISCHDEFGNDNHVYLSVNLYQEVKDLIRGVGNAIALAGFSIAVAIVVASEILHG